jgi:hypothetical protein
VQGAPELSEPIAADRIGPVDPEHAVLVSVEGDRLAMLLEVAAQGREVGEGRLRSDEPQVHQPRGRIIDEHQQSALRAPLLEPAVLAAVDFDEARAARAAAEEPAWYYPRAVELQFWSIDEASGTATSQTALDWAEAEGFLQAGSGGATPE